MSSWNGYPYYEKAERCDGCGEKQDSYAEARSDGLPDDFGGFRLECPECYRPGCEQCMPAGRGCICPDCEEAAHGA